MFKFFFSFIVLFSSLHSYANSVLLKDLLTLKPSENFKEAKLKIKGLKEKDVLSDMNYKIKIDNDEIQSIQIKLKKNVASEEIVKKDSKGFCLVQSISPDIANKKYFFFDTESKRRIEVNSQGEIKEIIIQEIPGAKTNRPCTFSETVKEVNHEIKKVN